MIHKFTFTNSSMVSKGEYNDENEVLTLIWASGTSTDFRGVPKSVWDDLCTSESAGKFYHSQIKGKF